MTYYISEKGLNANPGTYNQPWKDREYAEEQVSKGDEIIDLERSAR